MSQYRKGPVFWATDRQVDGNRAGGSKPIFNLKT